MREGILIADSSPLIALARIDELDLLPRLYSKILIPPMVWEEITVRGKDRPGAKKVSQASWLEIQSPDPFLVERASILVDAGEAEAIALVQNSPDSLVLLDDSRARRVAKRLGLKMIGTVGLLLRAKRAGLLVRLRPSLELLQTNHIYVRPELLEAALREVGE